MSKDEAFEIGLSLNAIGMLVGSENLKKIKKHLDKIEAIVLDNVEGDDDCE